MDFKKSFENAIDSEFSKAGTFSKGSDAPLEWLKYRNSLKEVENQEMDEKWSEKYKRSIDCNNPKGFSQRAHCQGRKKHKGESTESTGAASAGGFSAPLFSTKKVNESNGNKSNGKSTKMPTDKSNGKNNKGDKSIRKTETKEATGAGSSGSYETNAVWAKSTSKKDWRGARKTQIPGGNFVKVKKKCTKFPYCNQGDINALKIFENETLQKVIKNLSVKHNLSEDIIKSVILTEIKNKF
jgi:hypothetical protein